MSSPSLRVLCVTRAYPPVVGGMERLSLEFTEALAGKAQVTLVANRFGKKALPFFLPWAALRLRQRAPQVDVIHLGDALLTVLLPFLPLTAHVGAAGAGRVFEAGLERGAGMVPSPKGEASDERSAASEARWAERAAVSKTRRRERPRPAIAVTIHGLDILYPHPLYQALLRRFLPRVDLALCISRFVETECRKRFPTVRTAVMTPGLLHPVPPRPADRPLLEQQIGAALRAGPLLLSVARLVPRKGMRWFVDQVLPSLPEAHLLVLGDGPEHAAILAAARARGVAHRVTLVGRVADDVLHLAYRTADLFVMPNIPVPGDAEGFGLVALEAASAGLPVLAADLEGIRDAVLDGETGRLLPPGQAEPWRAALTRLLADARERARLRERAPAVVRERFLWDQVADQALAAFARVAAQKTVP